MSNFDIFFYKLASRKKYHLNEVRLFGDSSALSLQGAIEDIRMYLNKYPYHVSDYQLIVAMRKQYQSELTAWNQTLLYRLIQLYYELQKEHIFMSSKEQTEKVLNLIMLYEADFSSDLPKLDDYMTSARLKQNCELLFEEIGLDCSKPLERHEIAECLSQYQKTEMCDYALCNFLSDFLKVFAEETLIPDEYADNDLFMENTTDEKDNRCLNDFIMFVKERLANYQVYEEMVDKNNRRGNILAQLRVVDFINMSVDEKDFQHKESGVVPLRDRCRKNWKDISEDTGLEKRYASMLYHYRIALQNAEIDLEKPGVSAQTAKPIQTKQIPSENEIHSSEGAFTGDNNRQRGYDFREILNKFITNKVHFRSMSDEWNRVYREIKNGLDKMDRDLQAYAEDLSKQYSSLLEKRKKETSSWDSSQYVAGEEIQKEIAELDYDRDLRLKELQSPHMSPSLKFQDQLNMESSLEQTNMEIQFYIGCIQRVTTGNMFMLLAILIVLTIGHYTFLQPYVFQESFSLLMYLAYIVGIIVLMICTWRAPYHYFLKKIRKSIRKLQKDMDSYIRGYFEKAKHFKEYINDLNQLDYIHRYSRLQHRAYETKTKLNKGYLWHKSQVKAHLLKLKFFQELVSAYSVQFRSDETAQTDLPAALGDQVDDVIDCPLYWPQK